MEAAVQIAQCEFTDNRGPGLILHDALRRPDDYRPIRIESSTASGNAGAGFELHTHDVRLVGNLSYANKGDGIAYERTHASDADSIVLNTSARNDGAGIRWTIAPGVSAANMTLANNLVAFNAGPGVVAPDSGAAAIARNDSWSNLGAEYAIITPGPTNLIADPLFCGVASENYSVRNTSPAASTGPYGQIGAFGVGCNASTSDVPPPPVLAFALRSIAPNPAHGSAAIAFALPSREPARLALYDLAGRIRWSREVGSLGAGEHRVTFTPATGMAPGIYLVTLSAGTRRVSTRLAWVE